MQEYFDFNLQPGRKLKSIKYKDESPKMSVIVPFYNDKKYIKQTVISVLNQTYPYFELLIIDDGSTDKESLEKLKEIEELDKRIKVYHKKNGGLAEARDFGASKALKTTDYLVFLDADDLISETYLECGYWTLETNKDASWAYSDTVGFDKLEYTWNKPFNSEKMKKINDLIATSIVRKSAFYKVNGYELREKYVNEDWNFWLKLISKGMYPVHISCYGQWYRRKNEGELKKSIENKKRSLEIIKNTSKKINQPVKAIEYPKQDYNYEEIAEKMENMVLPEKIDEKKKNILFILPWMVVGETDRFNLELVKGLDKNKYDITIITTECAVNFLRQQFEEYATVYELGSFLNQKYWFAFVNYIIKKNKIDLIFLSNSEIGYSFLPLIKANNPNIHIIDYVYNEELYNRNDGYLRDSNSVKSVIDKTLTSEFDPNKYNKDKFSMDSVIKKMSDIFDQTIKNTNKELIENGKDLEKHIDLCKELITKTFLIMKAKYTLETDNYKLNYGYSDNYKLSIFKEKMWKYAPYRALIKIAQKFRIIEIIKKIGSRGK